MVDDEPRRNPSRCLSEHTLSEMVCDDEPRRNPSRCLSEHTLSEMVCDGPKAPQDVIPPDSNPGLSASVAMRAATVLRDALHPDLDKCRGEIHRYVRRVAVPAIARHVLYKFDARVIQWDHHEQDIIENNEGVPLWNDREEHKDCFIEDGGFGPDEIQDALRLSDEVLDSGEPLGLYVDAFLDDDERWLAYCLRGKSRCNGFAGYEKPRDYEFETDLDLEFFAGCGRRSETDLEFLAALPDRVLAALSEKPPQITLDFCAFLRSAHGQPTVDDIEFADYDATKDADALVPSMSLNFINYQRYINRSDDDREALACFTVTAAYLPSLGTARPVPVSFCPCCYPHSDSTRSTLRRMTAREVCAMGPDGASYHRLREAPTE